MKNYYLTTLIYCILLISTTSCSKTNYSKDCKFISSEDTPTGHIAKFETPLSTYENSDLIKIAQELLDKQCESSSQKLNRVVLVNKERDQLGILGVNCETGDYFGGLSGR